jgi:hypothetical protein
MITKLKKIINKINLRLHEQTSSAAVRYYIQISGRYGVKFYTSQLKCKGCFFRQEAAYKMGFGPKPLFMGNKGRYFYYVTQHAMQGGLSNEEMSSLRKNVSSMGWSTYDLFSDNVGKIKDKPVLIDFDLCTLG